MVLEKVHPNNAIQPYVGEVSAEINAAYKRDREVEPANVARGTREPRSPDSPRCASHWRSAQRIAKEVTETRVDSCERRPGVNGDRD